MLVPKLILSAVAFTALTATTVAWSHCGSCSSEESCGTCEVHTEEASQPAYTVALGLSGYSPVSYLDDNRAQPGSPEFVATHEGVTYFFTSNAQLERFTENPERYLPAYGGYCAFGCSVESHFVPDPTSFKVIDGQTHLFLKNDEVDALQLWNDGNQPELTEQADAYWSENG